MPGNLDQWQIWMGVPHSSVKGLPKGTYTATNLNQHGDPSLAMGLNNDVKNVFQVDHSKAQPELKISGEIYGGLTTLASYQNYHLTMQIKWGDKKWAPRLNAKRDSGVLFHCYGEHGAFWRVWKACQELQVQESDFGDYIPLAGPTATIKTNTLEGHYLYQPEGKHNRLVKGYSHAYLEPDAPHGEWNQVDLYALNDKAVFVINGQVVMAIENSLDKKGQPLTSGQLQIQSEGAEVYYRAIKIRALDKMPSSFTRYLSE
ncbi:DUF1080 domain-containing protein [Saccharobesus litoralis]|uniref:DUF1080 domain-containing protein n=2 Tax=Saccharobesus litoralis TaxID=2172099 RepID=A0A2S0VY09_9ALTE|nr:DUF1080 domain-containing protein [Saccharobesus litoralis]